MDAFENGEMRAGDTVYCSKALEDVSLLEVPSDSEIWEYKKTKRIPDALKYKKANGEIVEAPVSCFVKIKTGSFFREHWVGWTENTTEKEIEEFRNRADFLEFFSRGHGFRVERIEGDIFILLKIYGDSQDEVNEFVSACFHNDAIIWE
ncbi:MAG: hypothetical protein EU544_00580 [Promethearchaeota archaeon]|nr:MAG: hypothetical protein EU544_00580 [Candidatus Lokiarchaeota archaeon]